jgi:hypothetical protein
MLSLVVLLSPGVLRLLLLLLVLLSLVLRLLLLLPVLLSLVLRLLLSLLVLLSLVLPVCCCCFWCCSRSCSLSAAVASGAVLARAPSAAVASGAAFARAPFALCCFPNDILLFILLLVILSLFSLLCSNFLFLVAFVLISTLIDCSFHSCAAYVRIATVTVIVTLALLQLLSSFPILDTRHWIQSCCLIPAVGRVETSVSHRRSH